MRNSESEVHPPSRSWPVAVAVVAVVVVLSGTVLLTVRSLSRLPSAAVDQTREILEAAQDLAAAFRQGTVETRFVAYATSISGTTFLQVATIDRVEVFTREDRASILWGTVQLPDIVVSVTAPVQYTAYVDLDEPWNLRLEDRTLKVVAPPIRFNRPAFDASRIEFEIREGSILRDEESAMDELKRGLTSLSHRRTQELEPLIRDTARLRVEGFVRTWILQSFPNSQGVDIDVVFANETSLRPLASPLDSGD